MKLILSISMAGLLCVGTCAFEWSYRDIDEWPGICQFGTKQSPIALSNASAEQMQLPPLNFWNYNGETRRTVGNEGHGVEIHITRARTEDLPSISGGNLRGGYVLDNVHFHWDAEHVLNGRRYPLEAHYVHYKKDYGNKENAINFPDGIVVFGILFKITPERNIRLDSVIESMTEISLWSIEETQIETGFEPSSILPKNKERYYTYNGSLTTPGCDEVVTWIVFEDTVSISQDQLYELTFAMSDEREDQMKNCRPLQDLNGRKVLYISGR